MVHLRRQPVSIENLWTLSLSHRRTTDNRKNSNSSNSVSVKCVGASILLETQHNETKMMAVSRHVMVTVSVPISAFCAVRWQIMSPAKAELLHLEHSYRYVDNCTLLFVLFVGHGHLLLFETIRRCTPFFFMVIVVRWHIFLYLFLFSQWISSRAEPAAPVLSPCHLLVGGHRGPGLPPGFSFRGSNIVGQIVNGNSVVKFDMSYSAANRLVAG